ncbi:hypothetical protein HAN_1g36 (nucleomorph) [Hemiselmis andersenii]|uniref:Uncharacterized protein n=2 Tax=Hemiselmis andersenii TaxID=464988 RepID=A9BK49_HEMAN|nr:hypothetical protein HAN_1g36 [Hemiselmis andersenii]ABW97882.1 hypothetical protein HAN_1g36 [Hemiselmis andersenii]
MEFFKNIKTKKNTLYGVRNFFPEINQENLLLKKSRNDNLNSKFKEGNFKIKKEKSLKKIFLQNCEIIPGNFFSFYFSPLFKNKLSNFLRENLISFPNLYYLQKKYFFCEFKFLKKKKFEHNVIFFEGIEPKTKNFLLLHPENKKTKIKIFSNLTNFKSGKNFQKKKDFLKNLETLEYCSNFKMKIKPEKIKNDTFLDFFLDFDENSSFSIKPLFKFNFSELSSSVIIKDYNFLEKGLNIDSQIEIKKPILDAENLSFSILSEFKKKKLAFKNNCFHFFKGHKFLKLFDYQIKYKINPNLENNFNIEILQEKSKIYPYFYNQTSFSTSNKIFFSEKGEINFKTYKDLSFQNFFEEKIDFSFIIKNPIKFSAGSKKAPTYKILNENFFGNKSCLNEFDFYNSSHNYHPNSSDIKNKISKKSSFGIEKTLQGMIEKIFFISETFSFKEKNKIQSNINFVAGIKFKNFMALNIWTNHTGKKGIILEF